MAADDPFGPDDEDFDRFTREVGDGLKDLVGKFLTGQAGQAAWSTIADAANSRATNSRATGSRAPAPAEKAAPADASSGVWAVVSVDDGGTRVEQVFRTEIEALRAHQHNTDALRRVRFLPYGIAVAALDSD
ncbi:MAG: hypothetical protein WAW85_14000 [Gordonia sp. (in: high G+C Gram-positive bacteria)]|uniref:hypothetical protein n=1 Tax=Gordonia sp. (in: high G+C Gram-positive bacteria) TaxID=84139 RepID=UPI003BB64DE5